jgi:GrpB-like predicted nucleotidyltransferase (UPF0157 family)
MVIGLSREAVQVVPYQTDWEALYQRDAELLRALLKDNALGVEHIGSTALVGMDAKPIIDLVVAVGNITICLIGDCRNQKEKSFDKPLRPTPDAFPTPAALESLGSLLVMLLKQHDLDASAVRAHRDLKMVAGGSDCPAGLFYPLIDTSLVPAIKAKLAAQVKATQSN